MVVERHQRQIGMGGGLVQAQLVEMGDRPLEMSSRGPGVAAGQGSVGHAIVSSRGVPPNPSGAAIRNDRQDRLPVASRPCLLGIGSDHARSQDRRPRSSNRHCIRYEAAGAREPAGAVAMLGALVSRAAFVLDLMITRTHRAP